MGLPQSIAQVLSPREDRRVASAALAELDLTTDRIIANSIRAFQYFPETITVGRSVEYVEKRIIGGSHPLYQWMSSGARTVSFEAVFSRDTEPPDTSLSPQNVPGGVSAALNSALGTAAQVSNVIKNPVSAAIQLVKGGSNNSDNRYDVNIQAAVAWLMSKTYPTYGSPQQAQNTTKTTLPIANPPPKLMLYLPNSGIISGVNAPVSKTSSITIQDSIYCILERVDVTYEAFFRSGAPRIVTVALSFNEIIQVGNSWGFVDRNNIMLNWDQNGGYKPPDDGRAKQLGSNNPGIFVGRPTSSQSVANALQGPFSGIPGIA